MKIGIYGGSFNPCNLSHKAIAEELLKNGFEKIIILPTGNFYKKPNLLKGNDRIKMLELMFKDNQNVLISDYEFKDNLIYTYLSLDHFQKIYVDFDLYFVLGSDNLAEFHTWKNNEYILKNYHLAVIKRADMDCSKLVIDYERFQDRIEFYDFNLKYKNISSTDIRKLIKENRYDEASKFLDEKVLEYIKSNHIYSNVVE